MVVTIIVILGIVISVLAWTLVRVSARREDAEVAAFNERLTQAGMR
jgi:type II secretory pathway pseudopilin PulG